MSILPAIYFLILGVGLFSKNKGGGWIQKLSGALLCVFGFAEIFAHYGLIRIGSFFDYSLLGHLSIFESLAFFLLGTVLFFPIASSLKKIFYAEFATSVAFLLGFLYLIGYALPLSGIANYEIFYGAKIYNVVALVAAGVVTFFLFRSKYEKVTSLRRKLATLGVLFFGVIITLVFASFVHTIFYDGGFDLDKVFQFIPIFVIVLGVGVSVLVMLVYDAFAMLNTTTVAYAEKVTQNLSQAKAKDEAILSSIGEALVATGKDGNIVFVNKAFEELLGMKEEDLQGKIFVNTVEMCDEDGKEVPKANRPIKKILEKGSNAISTTISNDIYYKKEDGTLFPVAITIAPILVGNKMIGAVEVFRDITKEKAVDKEKTEFVSLASHQLRTPLSAVNWYAEMLLSGDAGKLNKSQKEYIQEVYNGNQRMVALVNHLLNVSRLELGTFSVSPESIDIIKAAEDAVSEQKQSLKQKKIKLVKEFPEKSFKMSADDKLLHMIFQNLLSNAVKYTDEGGKIIFRIKKNTRGIFFEFEDNGWGIPESQQDQIFKKLFRADNVKEQDTEGTGLGLYIVKSIVESTGGKISFKSKEGEGTTFTVRFPSGGMKGKVGTKKLE